MLFSSTYMNLFDSSTCNIKENYEYRSEKLAQKKYAAIFGPPAGI